MPFDAPPALVKGCLQGQAVTPWGLSIHNPVPILSAGDRLVFLAELVSSVKVSPQPAMAIIKVGLDTQIKDEFDYIRGLLDSENKEVPIVGVPHSPEMISLTLPEPHGVVRALVTLIKFDHLYEALPSPLITLTKKGGVRSNIDIENWFYLANRLTSTLLSVHRHNVVHRDIKESNVVMSSINGRWKNLCLIDFGSSFRPEHGEMIASQILQGTPEYWSPAKIDYVIEKIRSQQISSLMAMNVPCLDPYTSDRFALGIMLSKIILGHQEDGNWDFLNHYPDIRYPQVLNVHFSRLLCARGRVELILNRINDRIENGEGPQQAMLKLCNDHLLSNESSHLSLSGFYAETENAKAILRSPATRHHIYLTPIYCPQLTCMLNSVSDSEIMDWCRKYTTPGPVDVPPADPGPWDEELPEESAAYLEPINRSIQLLRHGYGKLASEELSRHLQRISRNLSIINVSVRVRTKLMSALRIFAAFLCARTGEFEEAKDIIRKFEDLFSKINSRWGGRAYDITDWLITLRENVDIQSSSKVVYEGSRLDEMWQRLKSYPDQRLVAWKAYNVCVASLRIKNPPSRINAEEFLKNAIGAGSDVEKINASLLFSNMRIRELLDHQTVSVPRSRIRLQEIFRELISAAVRSVAKRLPWEYANSLKTTAEIIHSLTTSGLGKFADIDREDLQDFAAQAFERASAIYFALDRQRAAEHCAKKAFEVRCSTDSVAQCEIALRLASYLDNVNDVLGVDRAPQPYVTKALQHWQGLVRARKSSISIDPGARTATRYYSQQCDSNVSETLLDQVLAHMPNRRFSRILDVGCGAGNSFGHLLDLADHVTGIDASGWRIAKAQGRWGGDHRVTLKNVYLHQMDSEGAKPYDLVVAFESLSFLADKNRALATISALTEMNGLLAIAEPMLCEPIDISTYSRFLESCSHVTLATEASYGRCLADSGFDVTLTVDLSQSYLSVSSSSKDPHVQIICEAVSRGYIRWGLILARRRSRNIRPLASSSAERDRYAMLASGISRYGVHVLLFGNVDVLLCRALAALHVKYLHVNSTESFEGERGIRSFDVVVLGPEYSVSNSVAAWRGKTSDSTARRHLRIGGLLVEMVHSRVYDTIDVKDFNRIIVEIASAAGSSEFASPSGSPGVYKQISLNDPYAEISNAYIRVSETPDELHGQIAEQSRTMHGRVVSRITVVDELRRWTEENQFDFIESFLKLCIAACGEGSSIPQINIYNDAVLTLLPQHVGYKCWNEICVEWRRLVAKLLEISPGNTQLCKLNPALLGEQHG